MQKLLPMMFFVVGICVASTVGCGDNVAGRPTPEEVRPALISFLETDFGQFDEMEITKGPDNIRLGNYNKNNQGWPVYADYQAVYTTNGMPMYRNSIGKMGMPMCYVLVADGRVFCFKSKLEKTMDAMAQNMMEVLEENPDLQMQPGAGFNLKEAFQKSKVMNEKLREKMGDMNIDQKELEKGMWNQFKDFSPRF
jgi:hypothetical protein